jgi:hypothetical protein
MPKLEHDRRGTSPFRYMPAAARTSRRRPYLIALSTGQPERHQLSHQHHHLPEVADTIGLEMCPMRAFDRGERGPRDTIESVASSFEGDAPMTYPPHGGHHAPGRTGKLTGALRVSYAV